MEMYFILYNIIWMYRTRDRTQSPSSVCVLLPILSIISPNYICITYRTEHNLFKYNCISLYYTRDRTQTQHTMWHIMYYTRAERNITQTLFFYNVFIISLSVIIGRKVRFSFTVNLQRMCPREQHVGSQHCERRQQNVSSIWVEQVTSSLQTLRCEALSQL